MEEGLDKDVQVNVYDELSLEEKRSKNLQEIQNLKDKLQLSSAKVSQSQPKSKNKSSKKRVPSGETVRRSSRNISRINYELMTEDSNDHNGPLYEKDENDEYEEPSDSDSDWENQPKKNHKVKSKRGTKNGKRKVCSTPKIKGFKSSGSRDTENLYIHCGECKISCKFGCAEHQKKIDVCNLECSVGLSSIPKAGRGLWNIGKRIEANTLIGPYKGNKISLEVLEFQKETNQETGYAWEIRDENMDKVIGGVDPGREPDEKSNPLAFVNCGRDVYETNLVALQYGFDIYYRTIKPIETNVEMLVSYGKEFSEQLSISYKDRYKYKRAENWSEKIFPCTSCKRGFSTEDELSAHKCSQYATSATTKKVKTKVKCFKCDICPKEYSSNHMLKLHMNIHMNISENQCDICKKIFSTKFYLQQHMRIHSGKKEFKCSICGSYFTQNGDLKKHIDSIHLLKKEFQCYICQKRFSLKHHLTDHLEIHEHSEYACEKCGKTFSLKRTLNSHIKHVHEDKYTIRCMYCNKGFKNNGDLTNHKKKRHPIENAAEIAQELADKPHECGKCGKRFATKDELGLHKTHMHDNLDRFV